VKEVGLEAGVKEKGSERENSEEFIYFTLNMLSASGVSPLGETCMQYTVRHEIIHTQK